MLVRWDSVIKGKKQELDENTFDLVLSSVERGFLRKPVKRVTGTVIGDRSIKFRDPLATRSSSPWSPIDAFDEKKKKKKRKEHHRRFYMLNQIYFHRYNLSSYYRQSRNFRRVIISPKIRMHPKKRGKVPRASRSSENSVQLLPVPPFKTTSHPLRSRLAKTNGTRFCGPPGAAVSWRFLCSRLG